MKKLFKDLYEKLNSKSDVVLCSIIASSGSTPRGAGAKMLVFPDGSISGTIGGGKVEYKAIEMAKDILSTHEFKTQEFCLNKDDVLDLGMVCGGNVTVYFRFFSCENEKDIELVKSILSVIDNNENVWLITSLCKESLGEISIYSESKGFINSEPFEISEYLNGRAHLVKEKFFIEPIVRPGVAYIFGGGHVSQSLVPVISKLGFSPIVLEDRELFTNKDLFSGVVDTKLVDFKSVDIDVKKEDYIIIMTRGHQADFEILEFALKTNATYIGLIGSKHKWQFTIERLEKDGFTEADWARVHNPIGIDIMAETPDEIAISIAAELIEHRAKNT